MTAVKVLAHPAPWSAPILEQMERLLLKRDGPVHVHDPFAGGGDRLGALCDRHGWTFSGTEIEQVFIIDPRVKRGDSLDVGTYPRRKGLVIVTSPVYPNGIADDFNAQDGSSRRTYRATVAALEGADRRLTPSNMGQYGYRGSAVHSPNRAMYWHLASNVIERWKRADAVYVNVSDFMVGSRVEGVVGQWASTLQVKGWQVVKAYKVPTRRYRNGANRGQRVDHEVILHCVRFQRREGDR